jgi:hypothetical protein
MNHERCKTNLVEYLERTLPEDEMQQISLHLKECSSCRGFAAYLSESLSVLEGMKIKEADPFFYTRLTGKLSGREDMKYLRFRFGRLLQPALISLLFIATVFAGIEIGGIGKISDNERYVMDNLDPWLNEMKSEPIETFLLEE